MFNKRILTLISIKILLLIVVACNPTGISTPASINTSPNPNSITGDPRSISRPTDANLLILIEGRVLLQRVHWSDFHPVTFGTILQRGDSLEVAEGTKAYILCDNLQLVRLSRGRQGLNSCPAVDTPDIQLPDGSIAGPSRAVTDPRIPYIISPRQTKIIGAQPLLQWTEVQGASNYTVKIEGAGFSWETQTTSTELIYPGVPPLQPGAFYQLTVEVEGGLSSILESNSGLGFQLIRQDEAKQLEQAVERLLTQAFPSDMAFQYAKAFLYTNYDLNIEAASILSSLVEEGHREHGIYRLLGDLWWEMGLVEIANTNYGLSKEYVGGNTEGEAYLAEMLAAVAITRGEKEAALYSLANAQALYQALGSAEDSGRVATTIEQIK